MKNDNKIDFDLSLLSLEELVSLYNSMVEFIDYLKGSKVEIEKVDNE